jgi:hypothetical protein
LRFAQKLRFFRQNAPEAPRILIKKGRKGRFRASSSFREISDSNALARIFLPTLCTRDYNRRQRRAKGVLALTRSLILDRISPKVKQFIIFLIFPLDTGGSAGQPGRQRRLTLMAELRASPGAREAS